MLLGNNDTQMTDNQKQDDGQGKKSPDAKKGTFDPLISGRKCSINEREKDSEGAEDFVVYKKKSKSKIKVKKHLERTDS